MGSDGIAYFSFGGFWSRPGSPSIVFFTSSITSLRFLSETDEFKARPLSFSAITRQDVSVEKYFYAIHLEQTIFFSMGVRDPKGNVL